MALGSHVPGAADAALDPATGPRAETGIPYPIFLSVVIVERDGGGDLRQRLSDVIARVEPLVADFEIVLVDNGSSEEGRSDIAALTGMDGLPNVQVYHLLKAVDAEAAYWAGIENSLGDYVLAYDPYDEDLAALPEAIGLALSGKDIVLIRNREREAGGKLQAAAARGFRKLYRMLYGIDLAADAAQFRLLSKRVVSFLMQMPRPALRYRALPSAAGFARETIFYNAPRVGGRDFRFSSRLRRALNLVFSSTLAPLRIVSILAMLGSLANLFYSFYVVIVALSRDNVAPGWTTLSLQQSGMFFLLSIVLVVLTEYLVRLMEWTMDGAPYFIVGEATSSTLTRTAKLNVEVLKR
ncbi:MAG TPA: glycosyltransferase [Sphingomicrobium sp.]